MAISQLVTVAPGDRIQAGVWNNEIQNIITQSISLISPTTGAINFALQPYTGLLPSVITATSGITGQVLTVSSSGTSNWASGAVPSGVIMDYAGTSSAPPSGWLICDGT